MILKQVVCAALLSLAGVGVAGAADGFIFDIPQPAVRVTIPDIPSIKMERHPLNGEKPHLQFLGNDGPLTLSIITPTADQGITAKECAISVAKTLMTQFKLDPSTVFRGQANDHTFVILYGMPAPGFVQLHAHFVSSANGSHCIQVHLSKVSRSKEDLESWFKGFSKVDISAVDAQSIIPPDLAHKAAQGR